ncbi:MAG: DUF5984 family protein [Chloroflexota bacterium]|nr:DUF5984 family protein [Chloroflexota bacterium]
MPLFNFHLRPLTDLMLGTHPDKRHLSWFKLTDGWYWLDTGSAELFKYTPEIIHRWPQISPKAPGYSAGDHYAYYYVVRLWEDILELLPAVLEPLPPALVHKLSAQASWHGWVERTRQQWASYGDDIEEEVMYLFADSLEWWWDRRLNSGYLGGAGIYFWTDGTHLHSEWDNRKVVADGIPVWQATWGRTTMPLADFLAAVRTFDNRLMSAMAERVAAVQAYDSRPNIVVDLPGLQREQQERCRWLAQALTKVRHRPSTDWDRILTLMERIEAL